jgi:transposase
MYLREVTSKRKHGPDATYVQLCESEWDPKRGSARTRILHSFGRKEELDLRQIGRLAGQLASYLGAEESGDAPGAIEFTDTWDFGGPHLLDGLWRELGLEEFFGRALRARRFEAPVERALLAMVAQRALAPDSKLAGSRWAGGRAWIPGLERGGEELEVQHFYRAMDFLAEAMDELREHLYFQVTDLLNADVSVLFYDTTSVSFQLPVPDQEGGLRRLGKSKKKRGDLPQVVLGLAINRDGLPVRHWVFPGNTVDVTTVEGVVGDLLGLRPRRFLFIGDRGLVSQGNLDFLESRRLHYLLGSKLRDAGVVQQAVLSLRGRYRSVTDTLGVKETTVTEGGRKVRYLLCRDTARAVEDRAVRREIVARLEQELDGSRVLDAHTRKACRLLTRRGYARYLRETDTGGLEIDRSEVRDDERLDGKYVLMTNELKLPAEELVLGYRDMWRAERAFRSMKSVLRIEPVHHRAERRILAHAHLCVLAYLLMRLAENRTGESWPLLREILEQVSVARIETGHASIFRVKQLKESERILWNSCGIDAPPRTLQVTT